MLNYRLGLLVSDKILQTLYLFILPPIISTVCTLFSKHEFCSRCARLKTNKVLNDKRSLWKKHKIVDWLTGIEWQGSGNKAPSFTLTFRWNQFTLDFQYSLHYRKYNVYTKFSKSVSEIYLHEYLLLHLKKVHIWNHQFLMYILYKLF